MKTIFITILLFLLSVINAQEEFSFEMYFEDFSGNKDTITLGYDSSGTDSIDIQFNETNIINSPLDSMFDVRITNNWPTNQASSATNFHTKKQIIKNNCGGWFSVMNIDIKCKNWPVTVRWDNNLFGDSCNIGSLFTSVNPGGWFDTGSPSDLWRVNLVAGNQATFSSNSGNGTPYSELYGYINNSNDTIAVFWATFGGSFLFSLSINENDNRTVKLYPNPAQNQITLELQNSDPYNYSITDLSGKTIRPLTLNNNSTINIEDIANGYYFIQVYQNGYYSSTALIISR